MTEPPNRYNQSSIIKELEKRNLGTKATRADILDRLFQRGYIEGVQIKVLKLGMETTEILEKYVPTIVDEKLTAYFESEMDKIREGKQQQEKVLTQAKSTLTPILEAFHKKEKVIGQDILKSLQETRFLQNYIGKCKACEDGTLQLKKGKFGFFIACSKYPDCKTTFKIPQGAIVKGTGKVCEKCTYPLVDVRAKGRRPQEHCINQSCITKTTPAASQPGFNISSPDPPSSEKGSIEEPKKGAKKTARKTSSKTTSKTTLKSMVPLTTNVPDGEKVCPKCTKSLLRRRSFYGEFYGCTGFPTCKYTENINPPTKIMDSK